jgi:hypothetical protein
MTGGAVEADWTLTKHGWLRWRLQRLMHEAHLSALGNEIEPKKFGINCHKEDSNSGSAEMGQRLRPLWYSNRLVQNRKPKFIYVGDEVWPDETERERTVLCSLLQIDRDLAGLVLQERRGGGHPGRRRVQGRAAPRQAL